MTRDTATKWLVIAAAVLLDVILLGTLDLKLDLQSLIRPLGFAARGFNRAAVTARLPDCLRPFGSDGNVVTRTLFCAPPPLIVHLRCRDVLVTEQLLHLHDVHTGIVQKRCCRCPL